MRLGSDGRAHVPPVGRQSLGDFVDALGVDAEVKKADAGRAAQLHGDGVAFGDLDGVELAIVVVAGGPAGQ